MRHLFRHQQPVLPIPCDHEDEDFLVYNGMRVFITQNRDKTSGVVNRQEGNVIASQRDTILLELPNKRVVFVYHVTMLDSNGHKTTRFPLIPGYAVTKCSISSTMARLPDGTARNGLHRPLACQATGRHMVTPANPEHSVASSRDSVTLLLSSRYPMKRSPSREQHELLQYSRPFTEQTVPQHSAMKFISWNWRLT